MNSNTDRSLPEGANVPTGTSGPQSSAAAATLHHYYHQQAQECTQGSVSPASSPHHPTAHHHARRRNATVFLGLLVTTLCAILLADQLANAYWQQFLLQERQSNTKAVVLHRPQQLCHDRSSSTANGTNEAVVVPPPTPPRIVFAILTHKLNHEKRLKMQFKTWAGLADVRVISTNDKEGLRDATRRDSDHSFPQPRFLVLPEHEGKGSLGKKTLKTWQALCRDDAEYYMVVDDDTFVVIPNLLQHLQSIRHVATTQDLFTGYLLTHSENHLIGGGGGIMLSNRTMRRFCAVSAEASTSLASPNSFSAVGKACLPLHAYARAGDVATARCLKALGVKPTHTDGFYPFPLHEMVKPKSDSYAWCFMTWWLPPHIACPPTPGAISFHYVPLEMFPQVHFWSHRFHPPHS